MKIIRQPLALVRNPDRVGALFLNLFDLPRAARTIERQPTLLRLDPSAAGQLTLAEKLMADMLQAELDQRHPSFSPLRDLLDETRCAHPVAKLLVDAALDRVAVHADDLVQAVQRRVLRRHRSELAAVRVPVLVEVVVELRASQYGFMGRVSFRK